MADVASENIMMIGPSQAGKTSLMTVLRKASARTLKNGAEVRIRPINDQAEAVFDRAGGIVRSGSINPGATEGALRYTFSLTCDVEQQVEVEEQELVEGPWPWSKPTLVTKKVKEMVREPKTFTLTVLDGKGGNIFGERDELMDEAEYKRQRAELVKLASQSVALVVCVNASNPKSTGEFFEGLERFLDEVHKSGVRTPFDRVAVALTQADRKVERFGSSAQDRLEAMDPGAEAAEAMGFFAASALFQALEAKAEKQVYAGWVSVYGFIPGEGSVNFDSANNRIAIFRQGDAKWTDDWVPYGVIEPFLFACTGEVCGLSQMSKPARDQGQRRARPADPKPDPLSSFDEL